MAQALVETTQRALLRDQFQQDALAVLTHQPGIGRPAGNGLRELIISRQRGGYLAKYHFNANADLVRVLRVRHQRESGYAPEEI